MIWTYKTKTDQGKWNPEAMKKAIEAFIIGEMGYKRAPDCFHVPHTTLERRVKLTREQAEKLENTFNEWDCVPK